MTANNDLDFSMDSIPEEWTKASEDASSSEVPKVKVKPGKPGKQKKMPSRQKTDLFSAGFLGTAVAIASGVGWYFIEVNDPRLFWWGPVIVGLLIGLGVRIAGGSASPGKSFAISTLLLCITIFVVGLAIARSNLNSQFSSVDRSSLESQFILEQFTHLNSWIGLVGAFFAMAITSFGGAKRS